MICYNYHGDNMKSVKKEVITKLEINKSIFINHLIPVSDIEDVNVKLSNIRKEYKDANHHCFAYILGDHQEVQKYSDDGEPSGTAGMPMIEVLKKQNLSNVLAITIRYFGGVKLGAGGLVRSYTKCIANSIEIALITNLSVINDIEITIPFDLIGNVEKHIRDNYKLTNTIYDTQVHYYITLLKSKFEELDFTIMQKTSGKSVISILKEYTEFI